MPFENMTAYQLKLPKVSLYMQKQATFILENKMFHFSDIERFTKNAVECNPQIMPQNLILQPGG